MGKNLKRDINELAKMLITAGLDSEEIVTVAAAVGHCLKNDRAKTLEMCKDEDNGARLGGFLCRAFMRCVEDYSGVLPEFFEYGAERRLRSWGETFQKVSRKSKKNVLAAATMFIAENLEAELMTLSGGVLNSLGRYHSYGLGVRESTCPTPLPGEAIDFLAEIVEVNGDCNLLTSDAGSGEIPYRIVDYPEKEGGAFGKPSRLIFTTRSEFDIWATFNTFALCGRSDAVGATVRFGGAAKREKELFEKLSNPSLSRSAVIADSRDTDVWWTGEDGLVSRLPSGALYANVVKTLPMKGDFLRAVRLGLSLDKWLPGLVRPFKSGSLVAVIEGDEFAVVLIKCGKPEENEPLPWMCKLKGDEASAEKGEVLYDALGPDLLDAFRNRRLGPGVCSKSGASWDASLFS